MSAYCSSMARHGTLPDFPFGRCWSYHGKDGQGAKQLLLPPHVGLVAPQGWRFSPCHIPGKGIVFPAGSFSLPGRRLRSAAPPGIQLLPGSQMAVGAVAGPKGAEYLAVPQVGKAAPPPAALRLFHHGETTGTAKQLFGFSALCNLVTPQKVGAKRLQPS